MARQFSLCIIYGSNRPGRFCDTIANWVLAQVEASGLFSVSVLDPLELAQQNNSADHIAQVLDASDAVLIITPEYNHSFPSALKQIIDTCQQEWFVKPVAFVSYGGVSGGIRAVEQLRQIMVELHAVSIRAGVSLANVWELFDSNGQLREPDRRNQSLIKMLNQLQWWTRTLKIAREDSQAAYGDVA